MSVKQFLNSVALMDTNQYLVPRVTGPSVHLFRLISDSGIMVCPVQRQKLLLQLFNRVTKFFTPHVISPLWYPSKISVINHLFRLAAVDTDVIPGCESSSEQRNSAMFALSKGFPFQTCGCLLIFCSCCILHHLI